MTEEVQINLDIAKDSMLESISREATKEINIP